MGAVVLVADSWKPSVVQLVPFAKANIRRSKSLKEKSVSSGDNKRCFPILAVTRSHSETFPEETVYSLETLSTLSFSDYKSDVSGIVQNTERPQTSCKGDKHFRKSARHSSMRESRDIMVKFTVQDLNEQNTLTARKNSASSIDTGVSLSTVSANGSTTSNMLPKPRLSDKKYLYKQNGFKKSASFTPGEIELQRQKELFAQEQAQKRKKYKLNVNQLPRSNTPIHDHDPDKLNMKQVIRFLQKQKPSVSPRLEAHRTLSPERRVSDSMPKTAPANLSVGDNIRSDLKTSDSMRSRTSEISIASRSKLVSRDSDIPVRTSPSNSTRYHLSRKHSNEQINKSYTEKRGIHTRSYDHYDRNRSTNEQESDRGRHRHSKKRVKEFKLHRFLTVAPNGEGQKINPLIISNIAQTRTNNWVSAREGLKSEGGAKLRSKSEDRLPFRRVSSERPIPTHFKASGKENLIYNTGLENNDKCESLSDKSNGDPDKYNIGKSATIFHQRSLRFQKVSQKDDGSVADSDDGRVSLANSSMIRLPSVHDFLDEEDEETVHSSSKSDLESRSITLESDNDYEQKRESNISRTSVDSYKSSICIPFLASSPRKGFASKPKHSLHVNLPKEDEETKEIRLSLRQEKDLTAQWSYMSDMASGRMTEPLTMVLNPTNGLKSGDTVCDKNLIRISTISMQSRKSENCRICDDNRLSPDSHMTPRSIGALSTS